VVTAFLLGTASAGLTALYRARESAATGVGPRPPVCGCISSTWGSAGRDRGRTGLCCIAPGMVHDEMAALSRDRPRPSRLHQRYDLMVNSKAGDDAAVETILAAIDARQHVS